LIGARVRIGGEDYSLFFAKARPEVNVGLQRPDVFLGMRDFPGVVFRQTKFQVTHHSDTIRYQGVYNQYYRSIFADSRSRYSMSEQTAAVWWASKPPPRKTPFKAKAIR
jgi:hypothetical protein